MMIVAGLSLAGWLYIFFGRGRFWQVGNNLLSPSGDSRSLRKPLVVAVVPARDEADVIGRAVRSLLAPAAEAVIAQLIVVDDGSSDDTRNEAAKAANQIGASERLTVLPGKALEPGWTGKLWALAQGVAHALEFTPEYLLLTDADIVHSTADLRALVQAAEQHCYDLASLMVRLHCESGAERLLIPPFVYFFLQLYPPAWIASRQKKTAGAAGGCLLIRASALHRIGGLSAVRSEVIDDCSLAGAAKRTGGSIWMKLAPETRSVRPYDGFSGIGQMIARTAFSQLRHSSLLLVATIAGLGLMYFVPVWATFSQRRTVRTLGLGAWALMSASYLPIVRFYRLRPWSCGLLPITALFYAGATIWSALRYWTGSGGKWKGRIQDARPQR